MTPTKSATITLAALVLLCVTFAATVLAQRLAESAASRHFVRMPGSSSPARRREPAGRPASATNIPRDPVGHAAVALAATAPGSILAAVYDVSSGQEWALGHGAPQAEAGVVKLDIIETPLARYRGQHAVVCRRRAGRPADDGRP
jgi:hypothetical protein